MATLTPHDPAEETRPIPLRDVEAEIIRRVRALQEPGEKALLRVRMSNLIIVCEDPERAEAIAELVPEIAVVHPARVLLLVAGREPRRLEANVAVRERSVGGGRTATVEWVTLRAGGPGVEQLPFAVRQLLVGNLPRNVWWAGSTPVARAGRLLDDLAEDAQEVLYDSLGWPDPVRTLAATAAWVAAFERIPGPGQPRWRVVTDLNWRRKGSWRALLTQALDPASTPGALETISEVDIEHGPHVAVQGWMLLGWLASRLGWTPVDGTLEPGGAASAWQFTGPRGTVRARVVRLDECATELQRVRIACRLDGRPGTLAFAPDDDCRLSVCRDTPGCVPRTVTLNPEPMPQLVGRQLSEREPDPIFRASLDLAGKLARML